MAEETLQKIAHELADVVRNDAKETARAKLPT